MSTPNLNEKVYLSDSKKTDHIEDKQDGSEISSIDEEDALANYDHSFEWTDKEEDAVRRKIDLRLMSFVLLMTFVLNMDRTNISNAISDNLAADLGFTNDGVNTATLVYSFVFTLFTLPSTPMAKKLGAHIWIPFLMSSWAIVTWAHTFIYDFKGFMCIRVFIAVTEAGFIPACLLYLSLWYKTTELATRLSWFWGIQAFASAFSGLISSGIFKMHGIAGLEGWKWLFLLDGIGTQIVGFVAFFYLPGSPYKTAGLLRGKGWFDERQAKIAYTRIVRDDLTKKEHNKTLKLEDVKLVVVDTKIWTHLLITFTVIMTTTPIQGYLPTMIKQSGFNVTEANLLSAPSYLIGLVISIFIARSSDKRGNVALHALIGTVWSLTGFLLLALLPDGTGRWSLYGAALFTASAPSAHGMEIAWMASNIAPLGKRSFALGCVIGAANICGVPGSQIYRVADSPRYHHGNFINSGVHIANIILLIVQRTRYAWLNRTRARKWDSMTIEERKIYNKTTKDIGSNRLDFKFRL